MVHFQTITLWKWSKYLVGVSWLGYSGIFPCWSRCGLFGSSDGKLGCRHYVVSRDSVTRDLDQCYNEYWVFSRIWRFLRSNPTSRFQCRHRRSIFVLNQSSSAPMLSWVCAKIVSSNAGFIALVIGLYKVFQRFFTSFMLLQIIIGFTFLRRQPDKRFACESFARIDSITESFAIQVSALARLIEL